MGNSPSDMVSLANGVVGVVVVMVQVHVDESCSAQDKSIPL